MLQFEEQLPPHSIEAEQSLIGALLLDNSVWDMVSDIVGVEDLYRADHRRILEAIEELISKGRNADVVTVFEILQRDGVAASVGGLAYLAEIANNTPSTAGITRYAEIVREKAIARRAIVACYQCIETIAKAAQPGVVLDATMQSFSEIAESGERAKVGPRPAADFILEMTEAVEAASNNDGKGLIGTATGLGELDRMTLGLQAGDMVVIAGRPGMGKTALALNIAEHVSINLALPVLVFSMEMPGAQLALRMTSSLSGVDSQMIRQAKMTEDEWQSFGIASAQVASAPIDFDETGSLTPTEMRARARRVYRRRGKLGLIVLDYLQLMQLPAGRRTENRNAELTEISRAIKALAKELHVPVIALSQLNRNLEQRQNKRPNASDLRESGAIEQDADLIMFIYRDEIYNADSPDRGMAEVIIGKQRNGPTGVVKLAFDSACSRFRDCT